MKDHTMVPTPEASQRVLEILETLPAKASAKERWDAFSVQDWPALYPLLDLAADMPRLAANTTWNAFPESLWPELATVRSGLGALQHLVDHPAIPHHARPAPTYVLEQLEAATLDLGENHCVHVDFLLPTEDQAALDAEIANLSATKMGTWGELDRESAAGVHDLFEKSLASEAFAALTGFDLDRDEYSLTLSLQDLQPEGIGWHRDLYWPKEWVGEDVFAVLYALGSDSPELGGAFLHYVPWDNEVLVHHRQKHQATVMWNSADSDGRLIHAVSEYLTPQTARHLIILQCHRQS